MTKTFQRSALATLALFAFMALFAATGAQAGVPIPFTDCGSDSIYKIESLTGDYWPPRKGESFTMQSQFSASQGVSSGTYTIQTYLGGISVDTQNGDFCAFGDVNCPTGAGPVSIVNAGVFPSSAPNGNYKMRTFVNDANNRNVFCYIVEFKI